MRVFGVSEKRRQSEEVKSLDGEPSGLKVQTLKPERSQARKLPN